MFQLLNHDRLRHCFRDTMELRSSHRPRKLDGRLSAGVMCGTHGSESLSLAAMLVLKTSIGPRGSDIPPPRRHVVDSVSPERRPLSGQAKLECRLHQSGIRIIRESGDVPDRTRAQVIYNPNPYRPSVNDVRQDGNL